MKKLSLLLVCLITLSGARSASAHPADMYYQSIRARLSPAGVQLDWEIVPGPILTQVIWIEADRDQDGSVSGAEARGWAEPVAGLLQLTFDGTPLEVRLEAVEWPSSLSGFQSGYDPISIRLSAGWPEDPNREHGLLIQDGFNSGNSVIWFYVVGEQGVKFHLPEQRGGTLAVKLAIPSLATDSESAPELTAWESGKPSIPGLVQALGLGEVAEQAAGQAPQKQGVSAILEGLVRSGESSPWFILAALAIAAIVGALHALTPGHGKTIVAAYLIGSRGTLLHAVFLGGIVTLTHTGSVFLLGLVTLTASQYILPTTLFPVLEILSGVLIIGLGASLLYQRVRVWRKNCAPRSHDRGGQTFSTAKVIQEHKGKRNLAAQKHAHDHGDGRHHSHEHHDGHGHDHDHHVPDPSQINWRTLVTLGISGGLVPCPEAIAILLLAINISRILLGLSLILAFSLGLAFILIAIGIVMVQSKRLFARLGFIDRWAYAIPIVSAVIVFLLGLALTFSAVKNVQARATGAGTSPQADGAQFGLAQARVTFMSLDEDKRSQLYVTPAVGGEITALTRESQGVRDYSISPDGAFLAYSASDESGGTMIWRLDPVTRETSRLLACPTALCSKMVWPRSGNRALYSRLGLTADEPALGVPSIWWLDLSTGDTGPVFQDANIPALNFDWSASGAWLSYTSAVTPEIKIHHLQTGESYAIPTLSGGHIAWSPAEDMFLLADVLETGDAGLQKVFRFEPGSVDRVLLIDDLDFEEYDPAWSPDGQWIAMVRYEITQGVSQADDQIWLARPDGSQAHPVTADADALHGRPVWSPDGRYILFTYSGISDPHPRIWILEIETRRAWEVSPNGNHPLWLH